MLSSNGRLPQQAVEVRTLPKSDPESGSKDFEQPGCRQSNAFSMSTADATDAGTEPSQGCAANGVDTQPYSLKRKHSSSEQKGSAYARPTSELNEEPSRSGTDLVDEAIAQERAGKRALREVDEIRRNGTLLEREVERLQQNHRVTLQELEQSKKTFNQDLSVKSRELEAKNAEDTELEERLQRLRITNLELTTRVDDLQEQTSKTTELHRQEVDGIQLQFERYRLSQESRDRELKAKTQEVTEALAAIKDLQGEMAKLKQADEHRDVREPSNSKVEDQARTHDATTWLGDAKGDIRAAVDAAMFAKQHPESTIRSSSSAPKDLEYGNYHPVLCNPKYYRPNPDSPVEGTATTKPKPSRKEMFGKRKLYGLAKDPTSSVKAGQKAHGTKIIDNGPSQEEVWDLPKDLVLKFTKDGRLAFGPDDAEEPLYVS
ncbi:MAG: hypothetical protein M1833_004848 [Piccolia ochrophora]|nr:MAG: hypothetical protein M1833_004848 [Piccolia ochrophora]